MMNTRPLTWFGRQTQKSNIITKYIANFTILLRTLPTLLDLHMVTSEASKLLQACVNNSLNKLLVCILYILIMLERILIIRTYDDKKTSLNNSQNKTKQNLSTFSHSQNRRRQRYNQFPSQIVRLHPARRLPSHAVNGPRDDDDGM